MPEWMHQRADHILAKNPSMPKSEAFAIATQQMHALGKSPKGYGTAEGRATAKAKFDTPKDDEHKANPGHLKAAQMHAFVQELGALKEAGVLGDALSKVKGVLTTPIPGTPSLMPEAVERATRFGAVRPSPAASGVFPVARAPSAPPPDPGDWRAARRASYRPTGT